MKTTSPLHAATSGQAAHSARQTLHTQDAAGSPHALESQDGLDSGDAICSPNASGADEPRDAQGADDDGMGDDRDTKDSVRAVLDIPELLEMTLSHLSTKDLTRCLTISKYWKDSILGSLVLRRKLFLEPIPDKEWEYLGYADEEEDWDLTCLWIPPAYAPSLVRAPTKRGCSLTIVEPHPIILPKINNVTPTYVESDHMPCDQLRTVPPETFLFQPPGFEELTVEYKWGHPRYKRLNYIESARGVTFGDILKTLDELRQWNVDEGYDDLDGSQESEEIFLFKAAEVIASTADEVKTAREALAKAQSFAGGEKTNTKLWRRHSV